MQYALVMDRRPTAQQALRLCCDRIDAFLSSESVVDESAFGRELSALYAEINRRNIEKRPVTKDDKFLRNKIDDAIIVPVIPGRMGSFVDHITTVIVNSDRMRPDAMQRSDVKYNNNKLLDSFTVNVLNFLNHYGYHDESYMHLNATLLSVMNCVVKFNIANGCTFSLTVSEIVTHNEDGDPFVRKHTGDFSYYNAAHYLERVEAAPAINLVVVKQDNALIRLIDIIISIAFDEDKSDILKRQQISIKLNMGIRAACMTELQENVSDSMALHHTVHELLLNYCTVFVFSKLIGLPSEIAEKGVNRRLVVLSFIVRSLLMRDYSNFWITELINYIISGKTASIWQLFP